MKSASEQPVEAVVVGCSAGGFSALHLLLAALPDRFPVPMLIVEHVAPGRDSIAEVLQPDCQLAVFDAKDGAEIEPATVYIAAPGYHMRVESDYRLSLGLDEKVCNSRPSIDVLFESAARVWKDTLIGVILTGANHDGAEGLRKIRDGGGIGIVQEPGDAEVSRMPAAALAIAGADYVVPLGDISGLLGRLVGSGRSSPD